MDVLELLVRNVRIDLRRCDRGVSEPGLYRSDVRAVPQEVRRERVPHRVRRDAL